jgi:hypothetical protein
MLKNILFIILPFLAPFALYALWFRCYRRRRLALDSGTPLTWAQRLPWLKLMTAGVVLLLMLMSYLIYADVDF